MTRSAKPASVARRGVAAETSPSLQAAPTRSAEAFHAPKPPQLDSINRALVVLTAPGESAALQPLLPDGLTAYELISITLQDMRLRDRNGHETPMRVVPPLCVGLVSVSEGGVKLLEEAAPKLAVLGFFQPPRPMRITVDDGPIGLMLATNMVQRLQSQALHAMRLSRELAALRATYEHAQNAFAQLENFVATAGLQPIRLSFENPPECAHVVGGGEMLAIRQLLPVSILGLSALELHLAEGTAPGGLIAELRTIEDGDEHARWEFSSADLRPGWLILALPHAVTGLQRTPELILRRRPADENLPFFTLGAPQPLTAFCTVVQPERLSQLRSLALRTWSGLPGVRPPSLQTPSPPPSTGGPRTHEVPIPFSVVRRARQVPTEWKPDFSVFEPRPDVRGFLCHPGPGDQITMVTLDGLDLTEPSRFSARGCVHNREAAPVEFGIAFTSLPVDHAKVLMQEGFIGAGGTDFLFTGWRRVVHGQPALLSLTLLGGQDGRLLFATRMADQGPEWYAWATFGDMRQIFLGQANVNRELTPQPAPQNSGEQERPSSADGLMIERVADPTISPPVTHPGPPALPLSSVALWLSSARGIGFDRETMGVACPPPVSGVALRRLPPITITADFRFEATLHLANQVSAPVEFGVACSDLSAGEVLLRTGGVTSSADGHFAFSGWRATKPGDEPRLTLKAECLTVPKANIFLMTRFADRVRGTPRALAVFTQIWTNAPYQTTGSNSEAD